MVTDMYHLVSNRCQSTWDSWDCIHAAQAIQTTAARITWAIQVRGWGFVGSAGPAPGAVGLTCIR